MLGAFADAARAMIDDGRRLGERLANIIRGFGAKLGKRLFIRFVLQQTADRGNGTDSLGVEFGDDDLELLAEFLIEPGIGVNGGLAAGQIWRSNPDS